MNVKGTVFLTGKVAITANFGEARWNEFMAKLAEKDPFFKNVIMSVTLVPVDKHLFFLDEMLKEFFRNDKSQFLLFGRVAAKFALSPGGPYHSYLLTKDIKQFVESGMPKLWSTYYDGGKFTAKLENNIVHLKISDIPIKHIYFEYLIMGYFKQALKIFGKENIEKRVRSIASGDDDIYYQYEIKNL
ncbi:MAG TPA: hypothetical protein PK842_09185 [Smithella sp.]|jgi:hypothetical protein|nr:hypothetical protein [Deltaproteobacteria bacterium]OQC54788.1 MAG: hypothetical protein BWX55_00312 [Deltaproteobacteria bacterium ADurb.Bin022]HNQ65778.1 hypothetical protein [Smithella sp.]HNY51591.1 hypothetical protein [Smithella sp.]HOE31736.1 hypothetical protein [Smithella sp.]